MSMFFIMSKCNGKPYIKEQKHKYQFKMSAKPIIGLSLATTKLHNLFYVLSAIQTPAKADFTLASLRHMGMESQDVSRVGTVRLMKLFLVFLERL